jgi:hypothetical protein
MIDAAWERRRQIWAQLTERAQPGRAGLDLGIAAHPDRKRIGPDPDTFNAF